MGHSAHRDRILEKEGDFSVDGLRRRLLEVCKRKFGGNVARMARAIGFDERGLQRQLGADTQRLDARVVQLVVRELPDVSIPWLIGGLGAWDSPWSLNGYLDQRILSLGLFPDREDE